MEYNISAQRGCELTLSLPAAPRTCTVPLFSALGRVLAQPITARIDVPPFPRSPYDGYALRSGDTSEAAPDRPVTLTLTEELPAGTCPNRPLAPGQAAKILTGAPVPPGADCVVKYEDTQFTSSHVTLFSPLSPGNIVPAGEDVAAGTLLAGPGALLSAALAGAIAGQGIAHVTVYKQPLVSVVSTGSELLRPGEVLSPGKIYGTNLFTIGGLLSELGCVPADGGIVADDPEQLAQRLLEQLENADLVITTGGASVGDYDYTKRAVELAGGEVLFKKLAFKPGGSMLAAQLKGKAVLGLSGNPGAAAVGLLRVARPYLLKLCGRAEVFSQTARVCLRAPLKKASPQTRFLRGRLVLEEGRAWFQENPRQGNGCVSSLAGCDLLAEIPAGSPPLPAGTMVTVHRVAP